MLKINIHTHAHFKELGDLSAVEKDILSDEIGTDSIMNSAEQFRKMREEFRKDNISDNDLDMIFGGSAAKVLGLRGRVSKEKKEVLQC